MEQRKLKLDSPEFAGKLRYVHRSPAYVRRPLQPATISDMVMVRSPKPKPKHAVMAAATLHAPRPKPARAASRPLRQSAPSRRPTRRRRRADGRSMVLYAMACMVFAAGLLVAANGMRANRQVAAQVQQGQHQTEQSVADNVVPSTEKPSTTAVRSYAVSPNLPRYLDIPKLKVHTRILSEGVTKKGELQVPWNIYDTGWYNGSSQPGQNGAMLVDGHSGIGKMHGVFNQLASLSAGDPVTVTRGDGQKFTYTVVKVQTVNVADVDMASMLVSADTAKPGLNLITCAGDQIPGTTQLNKRVLVYATMQ